MIKIYNKKESTTQNIYLFSEDDWEQEKNSHPNVELFFNGKKNEVFIANAHCTHLSLPANAQSQPIGKAKRVQSPRTVKTKQPKNKQPRKRGCSF